MGALGAAAAPVNSGKELEVWLGAPVPCGADKDGVCELDG